MAQPGSAPAWGAGGRWFKSSRPDHSSQKKKAMGLGFFIASLLSWILPPPVARFIAEATAIVLFYVGLKGRRRIYEENLRMILPPGSNVRKIALRGFCNFGLFVYEFFISCRLSKEKFRSTVVLHGVDTLKRLWREGRGIIAATAHLGHWELGGMRTAMEGFPVMAIALAPRSKYVKWLFTKLREHWGGKVVYLESMGTKVIKHFKRGGILGILGDRDYIGNGREVMFFGEKVRFPVGPWRLAARFNVPLFPTFCVREKDGKYHLYFEEPLFGDEDTLARSWARILEKYVRRYPDQWYAFVPMWRGGWTLQF